MMICGRMKLLELRFPSLSRGVATAALRGANAAPGPQGEKRRLVDFVASPSWPDTKASAVAATLAAGNSTACESHCPGTSGRGCSQRVLLAREELINRRRCLPRRVERQSALRLDLGSKRSGYYFPVPYNKRVCSEFVQVVRGFCGPENVGAITVTRSLPHRKRGSRLLKL